ncbi:hypothetical protein SAMN02746089_01477 [Caldanaerobius fijiensis DSM 17918]|uniref:DUF116 domain-containing protein n=2 Tax=Caldanaerobius TaxID=862261 RepID=A0A1M4ZR47_9THEO|nr:hypothetical protein SAMN02746089_01477 [Caldanaerobius fijiensis DSM 17918]
MMLAKKRILLGIALGIALVLGAAGIALIYLLLRGNIYIYKAAMAIAVILLFAVMLTLFISLSILIFALISKKPSSFIRNFASKLLSTVFSVVMPVCRFLKLDIERVQASYAEINNTIIRSNRIYVQPKDILILAPHCLQWSGCNRRITVDVKNCARCGKCAVAGLLDISEKYGVKLTIATGGTLARKKVQEYRPMAIVAIACERDLSSGIQDVNVIPVLGILNERPYGPCFNTTVNLSSVEEAVKFFLKEE